MNRIRIGPIEAEDLTALNELYRELTGQCSDPDRMARLYEAIRIDPHYHLLGAYGEEGLVGTVMGILCWDLVKDCRPFMVVENVVVSASSRGRGVGKALMLELERIARAKDCAYIILVSGAQRKDAHAFYEGMGYRQEQVEGFRKKLHNEG